VPGRGQAAACAWPALELRGKSRENVRSPRFRKLEYRNPSVEEFPDHYCEYDQWHPDRRESPQFDEQYG